MVLYPSVPYTSFNDTKNTFSSQQTRQTGKVIVDRVAQDEVIVQSCFSIREMLYINTSIHVSIY